MARSSRTRSSLSNWLADNFGLVALILGFTVDTITLIALINSKVSPSIPFIDYPLDKRAEIAIWAIAAVTYLGFLRGYWLQLREKSDQSSHTFLGFLIRDMILLEHPFLLIPIIILTGFLYFIFPDELDIELIFHTMSIIRFIIVLVFLFILSVVFDNAFIDMEWKQAKSRYWEQRVEREINETGYVTDCDLARMYNSSRSVSRKALEAYLNKYESTKPLVLANQKVLFEAKNIQAMVLTCRSLFGFTTLASNKGRCNCNIAVISLLKYGDRRLHVSRELAVPEV